ncbi:OstA family protein [Campylobacter jejuni subsp. jejuni 60004]|uniref:LptA/OstA family protein n=1 Tax=Campylobacter jejuni TaxID=197 RepID=UPI000257FE37|nr:LptA/OstA family protein [Campylobacter jejuni]EAH8610293.1 organic solvent tolerance protein OstA [Campylobacter jejuni]EAI0069372.1 organic solvent tolerance protein OstA [Campylobacter jejuni]EAI2252128.1 organic solvent tolerance protein OstA [Campylobacter jejuni]EAI3876589.1 organic solvent tolerance protein OstA [Campylobacter jejuni]EAI4989444.1 organic solvent tolerance protein OstA [Campylobacter jejuni]
MVARQIILLLACVSVTWATQIEVKALNFYSDENKGESILSGNVEVIRGDDILNSEKLIIYTDKNRKPIRYEAMQNARFKIVLKGKTYKGSGDKFIYNVIKDTYEINGYAYINELGSNQKLFGDKIIVDRKANIYRVESKDQKPARFVFDLKDK